MNVIACEKYMEYQRRLEQIDRSTAELADERELVVDEMHTLLNFELSNADLEYIRKHNEAGV